MARRYNYATAKSYLELISLFKSLLASKRAQLGANKARLQSGVEKISQASAQAIYLQFDSNHILRSSITGPSEHRSILTTK